MSEQRLWTSLRNRSCLGYKFRRQVAIGRYVVDFYCHRLKLAIELDGRHHETAWMADYDGPRTAYLRRTGIEVLRIPNAILARDARIVEEMLDAAIERQVQKLRFR